MISQTNLEEAEEIPQEMEEIKTDYAPAQGKETRWFFDYDRLIWEIKAKLHGGWLTSDANGCYKIRKPKGVMPFMNDLGIENTCALLNGFVTKIQALSIIDEDRIMTICRGQSIALSHYFYENMDAFGLTPTRAKVVRKMLMDLIEANWRKSIQGKALSYVVLSEKRVETIASEPKKQGWLGF